MSNNQRVYTVTFVDGRTDTGHETHSAALTAADADGVAVARIHYVDIPMGRPFDPSAVREVEVAS